MLWTLAYYVLMPLFKILYRFKVIGKENLLTEGPVIVAANHMSYLDPIVLGLAYRRKILFLAKEELFEIPLFRTLIRSLYAFPIRRGKSDRRALRAALSFLSQNKAVGLFPEGTRNRQGKLGPLQTGIALLAFKSGAPIAPLGIVGTDKVLPEGKRIPRFPAIKAIIGKPIFVKAQRRASKEKILALRAEVREALNDLLQKGAKVEDNNS